MANNAFDYWKRRSETGHRYAPVLDQNPAKREWQIRTAASRLTPIGSAATINSSRTTLSSPTSAAATFTPAHNSGSFGTTSSLASLNLESLEPDVLISTLSRSPTNGNIFTVLRKKLANKNPSDNWIDAYCKADGIHFLLDAWKTSRDRPLQKLSDAYFQRECMECLKVAMESPVTLDYVTDDVESQQKILAALDSSNVAVKKQAMDLLSSLCGHNQEGYQKVLDTFERYKAEKSDGSRFQLLVDELRQGKTSAYRTTLIALINAIICNNETLRSRIRIRNEFLALKLHDVLAQIRNDANHEDTDLFVQLDTFEEQKFADDANLSSPDGLDLTNLMDVFHAILAQVSSTPQEAVFLTLLQHLLQVDPNGTLGDVIWSTAEKLVHRASLLESKEDADLLLRPPVNVNPVHSKLDRLKSQHDLSSPIAVLSTLPSSDSPHQYSDIPVSNSVPPPPPPPPTTASPAAPPPPPPPAPGGPDNAKGSKGPPPPAPPKANPSQISSPGGPEEDPMTLLQQHIPKPKTKLKTLNWNKIPSHKIVGRDNLWTKTASGASSSIDFGAMEQLFAAPQSEMEKTKDVSVESDRKRKDSNEINLLEPKRSLNVNIFLKQFRSPNETIIDIIKSGKGDQIDADKLRSLLKILPESDEIDVLRSYEGNPARLGTAEKFILQLIDVPNYRLRIETMQFRSEYEANVVVLRSYVDAVILTAYDIKKNTRLHETLHMVLLAGNFLNTGGYAGNAAGFKLSSLLKLADIRANKPTMNLLHYVAEQASITNPDLLGFAEDMEYLQEAAKLSTENLTSEINCLNSKCQILIEQVEEADEEVQKKMHDFLEEAKVELKLLWLDGQEIEKLRIEMAEFFCEDAATFKLEDCFKIFQNFCIKFRKAVQENEQRKVQEEKAENRRKEEQEKRCRRQAAGELSDSALETSRSSISGWSSMPRRFSDRSTCADEPISENGTVFKRDTLESGYASDTGAKKRARKMIRSSDEDDLMEYLNQGADGPSSRTSRTMAGEGLPSFGRHSLRSRPAKSHDSSTENRERSTSGASHAVQTPSLTRQQNVEEWLCTNPSDSSADRSAAVAPYSKMNGTARPGSLNLQQESMTSPQVAPVPGQRSAVPSVEMPRRSTAPPLQTPTRTTSVVPEPVPATSPRIQQNFQPNPIGYATNGKVPVSLQPSAHQNSLSTTATLRNKWTPDSNEQKIQPVQQPRPWLPSKTLANTMHIFDPKAGCPGEPLSGTNSPASSSSENVQPTGGRSGEETDTDTINGSERGRKQLTATASQRLRKWRRLPATNGKIIDEEVLTDTSIEDHPRSGLSVRNQNPHEAVRKQSRTLREMRESKRGVPDVQPTSRRIAPSSSFTVADKMRRSRGDVTKSETDEPVQTARTSNGIMSVFDRLSAPKRTSPPLERSNTLFGVTPRAKTTVGAGSIAKKRAAGKGSDDNSDDAVSHVTSKSHGSDKSSGSSNTSASQATTKTTKVTLSSRGPNNNMTRAGDLGFLSKTRGGSQRNADGSFTTKVSDYTLAAAELPKVVNAALVLSAPVTSRMRH